MGGVVAQDSPAGPGRPSMRHTNPDMPWTSSTDRPAAARTSRPVPGGPGAQRTTTPAPSFVKSTTTVTPAFVAQAPAVHAAAGAGAETAATATASHRADAAASARRGDHDLRPIPSSVAARASRR